MICAIVLAAGRSQRMGTQKLLLPVQDEPIIAKVVDEVCTGSFEHIIVVVGRDADLIQNALNGRKVTFLKNPDVNADMLSSVRCGLRALPSDCEAVMVALGDQPGITRHLVAELIREYQTSGCGIVVPFFQGHRGHPMLFASRFRDELLTAYDGVGLHGLLEAHADEIRRVPVAKAFELEDVDTPEEYQRFLKTAGH